ncbi:MAG: hypothetical protein WD554_02315 [Flavobacteriaceae bacterium]
MDLQRIEKLLDAYFEGETSLAEEKILKEYFKRNEIAPHLEVYSDMFAYFETSKQETSDVDPVFEKEEKRGFTHRMRNWYSIAALVVVALGVTFFLQQNNNITQQEEQEALMAYEQTKQALNFFSHHFNESATNLTHVKEFGKTTNKVFK